MGSIGRKATVLRIVARSYPTLARTDRTILLEAHGIRRIERGRWRGEKDTKANEARRTRDSAL